VFALCLAVDASAQVVMYRSRDGKICDIRGIEPWSVGVSVPSDVYGDISYYLDRDIDKEAITTYPEPDVMVIQYAEPFEFEGVKTSSIKWIFYKGVLVEMDIIPYDNRLYEMLYKKYGEGEETGGNTITEGDKVVYRKYTTYRSPDAVGDYKRVEVWNDPSPDGSIEVKLTNTLKIEDMGSDGAAYRARK